MLEFTTPSVAPCVDLGDARLRQMMGTSCAQAADLGKCNDDAVRAMFQGLCAKSCGVCGHVVCVLMGPGCLDERVEFQNHVAGGAVGYDHRFCGQSGFERT